MHRLQAALAATVLCTSALAAQTLSIDDAVEVRVVNVEVRAESSDGTPIRGLRAEDFELLVEGEAVPIGYFVELAEPPGLRDAGTPETSGTSEVGETGPPLAKPYLAIVFDSRSFRGRESRRVVEGLQARLSALIEASRAVLVARRDTTLDIEQSLTSDPDRLAAALEDLARPAAVTLRGSPGVLLRRLEDAPELRDSSGPRDRSAIESQARSLLGEIRAQAQIEMLAARGLVEDLERFVDRFAALPGRRKVLYLGSGPQTRPAERLFRLWWRKYSILAAGLQAPVIESEMGVVELNDSLAALIDRANERHVSFYAHDPSGSRAVGGSADFGSIEGAEFSGDEARTGQSGLLSLASGTTGRGTIRSADFGGLVDAMLIDFGATYSLGFEPPEGLEGGGRIEVRLRQPGGRLRYFGRYAPVSDEEELQNAVLTASMTGELRNPLQASIEVGKPERQGKGTFIVPLLVKVPIARLALLPEEGRHVGRLSIVALAESVDGDLSLPTFGQAPVEIDNARLLTAMNAVAGHRLYLQVSSGEQIVTIGLRDDVAREVSTLHLAIDPEGGS